MNRAVKSRQPSAALGYALIVYGALNVFLAATSLIRDLQTIRSFGGLWATNVLYASAFEFMVTLLAGITIILRPNRILIALACWCAALFVRPFTFGWSFNSISYSLHAFSFPIACLIGLIVLWRRRQTFSTKEPFAQCEQCGYSLRGISEPRCPECGRVYTLDEFYRL